MSKLVVFLCVVICASAAPDARLHKWVLGLERGYVSRSNRINDMMREVRLTFGALKNEALDVAQTNLQAEEESCKKISPLIGELLKVTGQDDGANASECTDFANGARFLAFTIFMGMAMGIADKLKPAELYAETIDGITLAIVGNLTNIREEASLCNAYVNDYETVLKAIECLENAGDKANSLFYEDVPDMIASIKKRIYSLKTRSLSSTYCTVQKQIITDFKDLSNIVGMFEECVREKANGTHPDTAGGNITFTTEESTRKSDDTTKGGIRENTSTTAKADPESDYTSQESTQKTTDNTKESTKKITYTTQDSTSKITHSPTLFGILN